MRKTWLLLGVTLLGAMLALGAVACGDDKKDDNGGKTPQAATATEAAGQPTEADATEPADDGTPSAESATVIATENAVLGVLLTDSDGNTLYAFDNDSAGTSACGDSCVGTWPPYTIDGEPTAGDGASGTLGTIERDDGSTQVTYDNKPLYFFSGDNAPGDTNGDGLLGLWHVVIIE